MTACRVPTLWKQPTFETLLIMSTPAGGYYCPEPSPWPIIASTHHLRQPCSGAALMINDVAIGKWMFAAGAAGVIFMMFGWWNTVIRESMGGNYNDDVDLSFSYDYGLVHLLGSNVLLRILWCVVLRTNSVCSVA